MLDYEFREITLQSRTKTKRKLMIDFADAALAPLAVFLEQEAPNFSGEIAEALEKTAQPGAAPLTFAGNIAQAVFAPDAVEVTGLLETDESACRVSRADFEAVWADWRKRWGERKVAEQTGESL